jgi:DNA-binding IclR family transcriptional regulator
MQREKIPGTQVIIRSCQIMRCFDTLHQDLSLAEIVRSTGLHPPTAHRILQALTLEGFLIQDTATSRYRLGYTLVKLGELAKKSNDLIQISQRYIQDLGRQWGESTVIDVPDQNLHMESVLLVASTYRLGSAAGYDKPFWPHATAAGKVVMAHLPPTELDRFLEGSLPSYTSFTITDAEMIRKELKQVARQGYAVNNEEQELGLVAVAAPIFDHTGRVIAALSIGGPSARMTGENYQKIVQSVVATAGKISTDLGYDG